MVEESRKRTLVDEDGDVVRKKFNRGNEPLLKLLVPNVIAGVIIGKGGSFLGELKSKYGGHIRLSGNREYYPGTEERVVVITGKVSEIVDLNYYILEKLSNTGPGREPLREQRGDKVKIVVTNVSAGMLIGRGGATIKAIQEECQVKISIADSTVRDPYPERILTLSGTLEQRTEACKQIIEKISEEPGNMANTRLKYVDMGGNHHMGSDSGHGDNGSGFNGMHQNENRSLPFGGRQPGGHAGGSGGSGGHANRMMRQPTTNQSFSGNAMADLLENMSAALDKRQLFSALSGSSMSGMQGGGNKPPPRAKTLKSKVDLQLEVPDLMVGHLMGKQGVCVKDMVHRSGGARFRFSNKDEYVEGTTNMRTLTVTGNFDQVQIAYNLVHDRAEEFQHQQANH